MNNSLQIKQRKKSRVAVKYLSLFFVMSFFSFLVLVGCSKTPATVTIVPDRTFYASFMSSARGIKLTPEFKSTQKYAELEYHWTTEAGEFIVFTDFGKEIKNQGETVLWSAVEQDMSVDIKDDFEISVEVINKANKDVLASAKITIKSNKGVYEIKED